MADSIKKNLTEAICKRRFEITLLEKKIAGAPTDGPFLTTLTPNQKQAIITSNIQRYRREIGTLLLEIDQIQDDIEHHELARITSNTVLPSNFILA